MNSDPPVPNYPAANAPPGEATHESFVERWAFPILLVGLVGAAMSPIFVRLSEVGPIATAANRMILPLPIFAAMLWLRPHHRISVAAASGRRDIWMLVLSGAFFAADLSFWNWSVALTSVANATVLANLTPVFVVLAAWIIFHERFAGGFIIGLALALTGTAVMMAESLNLSPKTFAGDASAIAASWFYGGYLIVIARVRQRASTAIVMAIGGTIAAIILWFLAAMTEDQIWPHTARGWLTAIVMAALVQLGGQTLIAVSLRHLSAGLGSLMLLMQPVLPIVMAWLLFGERLSRWQAVGAIAVFGGLALARRATRSPSAQA